MDTMDFEDFARENQIAWQRVWGIGWLITAGLIAVEGWYGVASPVFVVEVAVDVADVALLWVIWRRKTEWTDIVQRIERGEDVLMVLDDEP